MLKFISMGSGSSGNCYYLFTDNDGLLIDVGVGLRTLRKHFRDYGLSLAHVRHIIVTHDHADHIKSVGSISHDLHLPVWATERVHQGIDQNYCVSRKVEPALRRVLSPGSTVALGQFAVTPFSVPHDSNDCVGYFVQCQSVAFCIITDAGTVPPQMRPYIARADYLVIEANHDVEMLRQGPYPQHLKERIASGRGHLSNQLCGQAIAQNMSERLRHVWLCHLSEENNHPELARKTVETVLRSYGIVVGRDLQLDVLKRTMPTGIFLLSSPSPQPTPQHHHTVEP